MINTSKRVIPKELKILLVSLKLLIYNNLIFLLLIPLPPVHHYPKFFVLFGPGFENHFTTYVHIHKQYTV